MGWKEKILQNKYGAVAIILALLVFVWWGSSAKAEGLSARIGPSQVGSTLSAGLLLQLDNQISKHLSVNLGYVSAQTFSLCSRPDCEWTVREQLYAGFDFRVYDPWKGKASISFGPSYFSHADRIGTSRFRASVNFQYRFTDRVSLDLIHKSTAGSGEDLTICRPEYGCLTNDWNTGQDSWLGVRWHF